MKRQLGPAICVVTAIVLLAWGWQPLAAQSQPGQALAAPSLVGSAQQLQEPAAMFVENVGQFDSATRFKTFGGKATLFVGADGLWFDLKERRTAAGSDGPSQQVPQRGVNLHLTFPGSNPQPQIEPFDRLSTRVSYFLGNDPGQWHTDVPVWQGLRLKDLYPGVDLEVSDSLRLVASSAESLGAVRMHVAGASGLRVEGGKLKISTAVDEYTLALPQVEGAVPPGGQVPAVEGDEVLMPFATASQAAADVYLPQSVGALDDPADLLISTFLGENNEDQAFGVALDGSGSVYVTGDTLSSSPPFPTTPGAYDPTYNGGDHDVFVAKFDANLSPPQYATFIGGSSLDGYGAPDELVQIKVDSSGNAYIAGFTYSADFPTAGPTPGSSPFDDTFAGPVCLGDHCEDGFLVKLGPNGDQLLYGTFIGGDDIDAMHGLALGPGGTVYIAGSTYSTKFPTTPNAYQTALKDGATRLDSHDAVLVRINPAGNGPADLVYGTYLGGTAWDHSTNVAVDASGVAYLIGETASDDFPTTAGAYDGSYAGNQDGFLAIINPAGGEDLDLLYATYLGGDQLEKRVAGIALEAGPTVYVAGQTRSDNFPTTANGYDRVFGGGVCDLAGTICDDAFLLRLNPAGNNEADPLYSTYLGDTDSDVAPWALATDGSGVAYLGGHTASVHFPTTAGAYDISHNGDLDGFLAKIDTNRSGTESLRYSSFIGGSGDDRIWGLTLAGPDVVYVVGDTISPDYPTTEGAYDTGWNGDWDAVIFKMSLDNSTPTSTPTPTAMATPGGAPSLEKQVHLPLIIKN
ncbi:MAG: hypothetical protein M0Z94_03145 [Dehalococcoidales bacterium]|nr:hypothetical protein [Dehalococcoidales bacterium]